MSADTSDLDGSLSPPLGHRSTDLRATSRATASRSARHPHVRPAHRARPWTSGAFIRISLYLLAAVLSGQNLFGPEWLVAGDVVLIAVLALTAVRSRSLGSRATPSWYPVALLVVFCAAISLIAASPAGYFNQIEGLRSLAKLVLYVAGIAGIYCEVSRLSRWQLADILRLFILLAALIVVLQQATHAVGVRIPILPAIGDVEWDYVGAIPRAHAFFSEPATMAAFLAVCGCTLLQIDRLKSSDGLALALAVGVSGSLSGVALLAAVFAIAFLQGRPSLGLKVRAFFVATFMLIAAALLFPAIRVTLDRRIFARLTGTLDRSDASGAGRLFDSWEAALSVAGPRPLTGAGIGQQASVLSDLWDRGLLSVDPRLIEVGGGWNILSNTYAEMGLLGLIVLLLTLRVAIGRRAGLVVAVLLCFATGVLLGWAWWCFVVLLSLRPTEESSSWNDPPGRFATD